MEKKVIALLLTVMLVASLLVIPAAAVEFSDTQNHWAKVSIDRWSGEGVLEGYGDGRFLPDGNMSRAELATVLSRVMKYVSRSSAVFPDVEAGAWYADAILGANAAGVILGDEVGMRPNDKITRQEAIVMLGRALGVKEDSSAVSVYGDAGSIADWAKGFVGGMTKAGFVQGDAGKVNPNANITRAEAVTILNNAISALYSKAGTYSADAEKNVIVNSPAVVLKDMTVKGDLIIAEGVGDGEVSLDGVKVLGSLIVRGGGENSIIIKGASSIANVSISRVDGKVRVSVEGDANVEIITVADGSDDVKIEGTVGTVVVENASAPVEITGTVKKLEVAEQAAAAEVTIAKTAKIESVTVAAAGAKLDVSGVVAKVEVAETAVAADISGSGKVESVTANANDVKVSTPGTSVSAGEGTSGVTAGDKPVSGGTTEQTKPTEPTPPPVIPTTYYTVTFDLNGGAIDSATDDTTLRVEAGSLITAPQNVILDDYNEVSGWLTADGETWDLASDRVSGDITLTAQWGWNGQVDDSWFDSAKGLVETDPVVYTLSKPEQLAAVAQIVNTASGNAAKTFRYATIKLTNDINLNDKEWTPIGQFQSSGNIFRGTFDGNDHTVSNLKITKNDLYYAGFFGSIDNWLGSVKNLTVDGAIQITDSTQQLSVGGIAGMTIGSNGDKVSNCTSNVDITITNAAADKLHYVGGIVGDGSGNMKNCENKGALLFKGGPQSINIGGICGNSGTAENCTNSGAITVDGATKATVGGIIGRSGNVLTGKNTGAITVGAAELTLGGIVGNLSGKMKDCTNTGKLKTTDDASVVTVGGVIGHFSGNSSSFDNSTYNKNEAQIEICGASGYAGGAVGNIIGTIHGTNSALEGKVSSIQNAVKFISGKTTTYKVLVINKSDFETETATYPIIIGADGKITFDETHPLDKQDWGISVCTLKIYDQSVSAETPIFNELSNIYQFESDTVALFVATDGSDVIVHDPSKSTSGLTNSVVKPSLVVSSIIISEVYPLTRDISLDSVKY